MLCLLLRGRIGACLPDGRGCAETLPQEEMQAMLFSDFSWAEQNWDVSTYGELVVDGSKAAGPSVSYRYHKLIWGPHSMTSGDRVSGVLIAGGENGNIILYDSAKILDGEAEVIIAQKDKHTGPVRALDVNMFQVGFSVVPLNIPSIEEWPILTCNLRCFCCFPSPEKHELCLVFECLLVFSRKNLSPMLAFQGGG